MKPDLKPVALRGFGFSRVQAQLEESTEAFTHLGGLEAEIRLPALASGAKDLDRVLRPAPPVAALVALGLAERPEPLLHSPGTLGHESDDAE